MQRIMHFARIVCKSNISVHKPISCNSRHLYSNNYLGITNFIAAQQKTRTQFGSMKDSFVDRMRANLEKFNESQVQSMIFSEDLKNLSFLTQTDEEFNLLVDMIKRYTSQNQGIRFTSFVFGPIVLRLCHTLNKPDEALAFMQNEEYGDFFQQITTYNLAANLLYRNNKFEEILQLYDYFKTKSPFKDTFPRVLISYVMASCYLLNTEESYKLAVNVLGASKDRGDTMYRRSVALISALALKRGDPNFALEVLSMIMQYNFVTIRHLRIAALCDVGRIDDALMALRLRLNEDTPSLKKLKQEDTLILNETLLKVKENVDKINNPEKTAEFKKIERSLRENNLITMKSFEEILLAIEERENPKNDLMEERDELRQKNKSSNLRYNQKKQAPVLRKGLLDSV